MNNSGKVISALDAQDIYDVDSSEPIALNGLEKIFIDIVIYRGLDAIRKELLQSISTTNKSQKNAIKSFEQSLKELNKLANLKPGQLEKRYNRINGKYKWSQKKAKELAGNIEKMQYIGNALFREWEAEIQSYNDPSLAKQSKDLYHSTYARYSRMLNSVQTSQQKMFSVLRSLQDRVTFLRHLVTEDKLGRELDETWRPNIEAEIRDLIATMEVSINEADSFINAVGK